MSDITITNIKNFGAGVCSLEITAKEFAPSGFKAGQYVLIRFGDFEPRQYSIANAPGDDVIEVHIKDSGNQGASAYVIKDLKVGDSVVMEGPFGDIYFDPEDKKPLLAIAGGIGITPLKSIIDTALKYNHCGPLHLFWGTNSAEEHYIADYFMALADKYKAFVFSPVVKKLVGVEAASQFTDLSNFNIFLAGPPPMISSTIPLLLDKGALRANIHYDRPYYDAG